MTHQLMIVLWNGFLLLVLWWMYFVEYRRYRLDATRQEFFRIRDELFADAARGVLPFDAPAYRATREMLNAMIRYAHTISLIEVVSLVVAGRRFRGREEAKRLTAALDESTQALSEDGRQAIARARTAMHVAFYKHIVLNSLTLMVVAPVLWLAIWPFSLLRRAVLQLAKSNWPVLEAEVGLLPDPALLARRCNAQRAGT